MKRIITFFGLVFLYFSVAAQISTDEPPISSSPQIKQLMEAKSLSFDKRDMPRVDLAKIIEEDSAESMVGIPPRFGYPIDVDFNLNNSGTWIDLPNGDRIWQLGIRSEGALSINLLYDNFWLPEGAKFFVFSEDRKHSIGAMTSVNNKGEKENVQGFATGLIYGESIVLEYYLPKGVED